MINNALTAKLKAEVQAHVSAETQGASGEDGREAIRSSFAAELLSSLHQTEQLSKVCIH